MKAIILNDLKAILFSKRFWIAVGLIVVCSAINTISIFLFQEDVSGGFLGIFIYGNIRGNAMMNFLAPFIPAFVFGPLVVGVMQTGACKEQWQKTGIKKSLTAHSISSIISGAAIFIVAYVIVLAGCFICDPTIQETEYIATGLFAGVYDASIPMYIVLFILYSSLFGAVYSFFSMGIGLTTHSPSMAMVLPGIVYQASYTIWAFIDNPILSWVDLLLPSFSYEFNVVKTASPILGKVAGLGLVILASVVMVIAGYKKLKRTSYIFIDANTEKKQEI